MDGKMMQLRNRKRKPLNMHKNGIMKRKLGKTGSKDVSYNKSGEHYKHSSQLGSANGEFSVNRPQQRSLLGFNSTKMDAPMKLSYSKLSSGNNTPKLLQENVVETKSETPTYVVSEPSKHQPPPDNKYIEMCEKRKLLVQKYIEENKMDDPDRKYSIHDARNFAGECNDMCPEYERYEREFQNGLMEFEKIPGTNRVDHAKAVKRYRRSAAGDEMPLPSDVRPLHVLRRTLDYLMYDIVAKHGLDKSHSFVRDRTRAIRKDITMQNIANEESIFIYETIARYHLLCSHRLCETIDIKQEYEQLEKTLQSLIELYDECLYKNIKSKRETEFRAYYLLHYARNQDIQANFEYIISKNRPELLNDRYLIYAIRIRGLLSIVDYESNAKNGCFSPANKHKEVGSFESFSELFNIVSDPSFSYLLACALHPHLRNIRQSALEAMKSAFYILPSKPMYSLTSVSWLENILFYDLFDDTVAELKNMGVNTQIFDGVIKAYIGKVKENKSYDNSINEKSARNKISTAPIRLSVSRRLLESKSFNLSTMDIIYGNDFQPCENTFPDNYTSVPPNLPVAHQDSLPINKISISTIDKNITHSHKSVVSPAHTNNSYFTTPQPCPNLEFEKHNLYNHSPQYHDTTVSLHSISTSVSTRRNIFPSNVHSSLHIKHSDPSIFLEPEKNVLEPLNNTQNFSWTSNANNEHNKKDINEIMSDKSVENALSSKNDSSLSIDTSNSHEYEVLLESIKVSENKKICAVINWKRILFYAAIKNAKIKRDLDSYKWILTMSNLKVPLFAAYQYIGDSVTNKNTPIISPINKECWWASFNPGFTTRSIDLSKVFAKNILSESQTSQSFDIYSPFTSPLHIKAVLCTSNGKGNKKSVLAENWMKSIFTLKPLLSDNKNILQRTVSKINKGGNTIYVSALVLDAQIGHISQEPLSNDEKCNFSGACIYIYLFEIYNDEMDKEKYFNNERERFCRFFRIRKERNLSVMDFAPVLVVFWYLPQMGIKEYRKKIIEEGQFMDLAKEAKLQPSLIEIPFESSISKIRKYSKLFEKKIKFMSESVKCEPRFLSFKGMVPGGNESLLERYLNSKFNEFVDAISKKTVGRVCEVKPNIRILEIIIDAFNMCIDVVANILCRREWKRFNWPPYEFTYNNGLTLYDNHNQHFSLCTSYDWNSERKLNNIRKTILKHKPKFANVDFDEMPTLTGHTATYMEELSFDNKYKLLFFHYAKWVSCLCQDQLLVPSTSETSIHLKLKSIFLAYKNRCPDIIPFPYPEICSCIFPLISLQLEYRLLQLDMNLQYPAIALSTAEFSTHAFNDLLDKALTCVRYIK